MEQHVKGKQKKLAEDERNWSLFFLVLKAEIVQITTYRMMRCYDFNKKVNTTPAHVYQAKDNSPVKQLHVNILTDLC